MKDDSHYHLLDFTRGVAALAVLLWHYQHFFEATPDELLTSVARSNLPFYALLFPFYDYGFNAVEYFWVVSGFVFFLVYRRGEVNGSKFFIHRVARLYPLHFVTLLIVATLQQFSLRLIGHYEIYQINDLYHFVLNIFFASQWGLQKGDSFNGPIWSVSIEVLIYFVFYFYYRFCRVTLTSAVVVFVLFALIFGLFRGPIFFCGMSFYAGGIAYLVNVYLKKQIQFFRLGAPCFILAAAMLAEYLTALLFPRSTIPALILRLGIFPASVLLVAVFEQFMTGPVSKISRVGDITYSLYLIHIPVQIGILISTFLLGADPLFATNRVFFFAYFGSIIVLASGVFVFFERPAQRLLTTQMLRLCRK